MARRINIVGIRHKELDEDKLALALLMLAKIRHEHQQSARGARMTEARSKAEDP